MDKKMRSEVGRPIKKAEKILKKAEKNNTLLAAYDEKVRDPAMKKYEKCTGHKLKKPPKSVK